MKKFFATSFFGLFFFLFASSASAATLQKPPNNLGLVGYWPMNEGTSTQAGDFSGRGNTGTLTNMATPPTATSGWGNGKLGGGLNFDGVDDYVYTSSFTVGANHTLSAWIYFRGDAFGYNNILIHDASPYHQFYLTTTTHYLNFYSNGTGIVSSNRAIPLNQWTHAAITVNGSTITFYINGLAVSTQTAAGSGSVTAPLSIGRWGSNTFNGKLDDVRYYSRALSAAEVANLYQSGSAKINTSQNNKVTNGLVGLWSFDGADMSGTTAYDRSTSGNNGTLTNGPLRAIGKVGQGLSFDGADDYVDAGSNVLWDTTRANTVSFWVYQTYKGTGEQYPSPITLKTDLSNGFTVFILQHGGNALYFGSNSTIPGMAAGSIPLNVWTHVVIVFDGVSKTSLSSYNVYINGVNQTEVETGGFGGVPNFNNFGREWDNSISYLKGKLDDVRIYNRALTQAEITQLYNMGGSKLNAPQNNIPGSTLQSGLVGLWSFNGPDMSGNTAYDRSTSGNNGTLTNGPLRAIGKVGQGLAFDGVNDYVDVPYTGIDFERTDSHSFSAWVKWTSTNSFQSIFARYAGTRGEFFSVNKTALAYANANSAQFYLQGGVGSVLSVSTPTSSVAPGNWYHIVATYDGSSGVSGVKIYINGVSQTLTTHYNTLTTTTKQNLNWQIGNDQTSDPLQGSVDEMRIYNRVLTQAEVTQLYNLGR